MTALRRHDLRAAVIDKKTYQMVCFAMAIAHRKKKEPEKVRRALLDCAAAIAVSKGFSGLTVQAVADGAGVAKGGFFHHFPSKQALMDEVCAELLRSIDALVDEYMAQGPQGYGAFTRAYVQAILTPAEKSSPWVSLSVALVADPQLRSLWTGWLQQRLNRHRQTDNHAALAFARYAADGIWLEDLMLGKKRSAGETARLQKQLLTLIDRKQEA
jgi:AcrR family transcriptional regulator